MIDALSWLTSSFESLPALGLDTPRRQLAARVFIEGSHLTEYSPRLLEEFGVEPERYLRELDALGFAFQLIDVPSGQVKVTTIDELTSRFSADTEDYGTSCAPHAEGLEPRPANLCL